ncbi:MAG: hypothetical protein OFPII_43600 [Osedax symbiont Rs1]|nr:MAG: hypothetical protein OFPII_43600 [Osedax symbiont Rs1]
MQLPPLTALHYFVIAAKHLSFVKAANELHVTEGAVSRQMKNLAEYYAKPLFVKSGRGIVLSENGILLLAVAESALQKISQVSERLLADDQQITLNATTSFAIRWLLPKLPEFEKLYPQFSIQMLASSSQESTQGKVFDVTIDYYLTAPQINQQNSKKFIDEWLVAVCSPGFLAAQGLAINSPFSVQQLSQQKLILNEISGRDWRLWAKIIGINALPIANALKFEQDDVAIQAAVAGHGIALANMAYIEREMSLGSLVAATKQVPIVVGAHYLSIAAGRERSTAICALQNWLLNFSD